MSITLTDHDEITLATAAHGAVTLTTAASVKQAGRAASSGAIALSSRPAKSGAYSPSGQRPWT